MAIPTQVHQSAEGFAAISNMERVHWRFNVRDEAVQFRKDVGPWTVLNERESASLLTHIERTYANKAGQPWRVSKERWARYTLAAAADNEADPVLDDFIESDEVQRAAPATNWRHWLNELWDFDCDPELVAWAGAYLLLGVIQRAVEPGSLIRTVPLLVGPSECGKSALIRHLLPPAMQHDYFADCVDLSQDAVELLHLTRGNALVEMAEMVGLGKADVERLKSWWTAVKESARPKYGRRPDNNPHRYALVGTANPDSLVVPNDSALSKRLVVVRIRSKRARLPVEQYMAAHRNHLFKAAYDYYTQHGARVHMLPDSLQDKQQAANEPAMSSRYNIEEAAVLGVTQAFAQQGYILSTELLRACQQHAPGDTLAKGAIYQAMKQQGWTTSKRWLNGVTKSVWKPC